jgi:Skp family chaperone for outer membrane proteins
VEIMKKMTNPNKRRVAAKPEAANALSAALKALVLDPEKPRFTGAMRDSGASFRVDADSLFAGVLSWARVSNVDACFDPEEIGKIEGEGGKRLPWLAFARLQRDLCSQEKCATYTCAEFLVKMCQNAASGATFRNDVSIHAVDLCAALTEQEETFVEKKSADGERTSSWLKAPKGWENLARELAPLTLGVFLEDLDGYPVILLVSKAVIVIARAYYEERGWSFEMWPDELIAHTGVHPLIARFDGSKHVDGMPAYGVGQVSKGGSVFLVACITAAGDWIYGSNTGLRGGPQFAAAHVTAVSNVFISVGTNGKLIKYDDKERCAFVANGRVNPQAMREAVEKMKSGDYARDLAAMRSKSAKKRNAKKDKDGKSIAAKKSAKTRNEKKDDEGKSEAAMKTNKTIHENRRARAQLMYVIKRGPSFAYQMTINSVPSVRLNKSGFDSELAAAVGLNDRLKVLRLPAENETWFNADKVRKQRWKEEWQVGPSGTPM